MSDRRRRARDHQPDARIHKQDHPKAMTFYRAGARVRMTRAMTRAMARNGNKQNSVANLERLIQNSKSRFGGAIGRPLAATISSILDSGVAFHTSEFLFFDDGEDDDGT
ncbi:hypothetical protein ATCC90586_008387 [Pythium insidiosum]|nr:hypothetical protein ATCC90586_008387 [Pythium insidiosum]